MSSTKCSAGGGGGNPADSPLTELLGETLLKGGGSGETADLLGKATVVGLYFSAHWCGPCRGFTPQLAKWYETSLRAKGLAVVFVSSDKDEDAFNSYFTEQPWLALPYADRARKAALSKKYKVRGIPSLVLIDATTGETLTTEGRKVVSQDPTGERFPWTPPTQEESDRARLAALGPELVAKAGGKPIGIYFSAHWCPPCRGFTPKLAGLYNDGLKENLEIVFVSSDRDEAAFTSYFAEMPWLALPYADRDAKATLSDSCGVRGIPSLVVIDSSSGAIVTAKGRGCVEADPKGATIASGGWLPQPFNNVNDDPSGLNEEQCVVALGDDAAMVEAVRAVAAEHHEAAGKDLNAMAFRFYHAPAGGVTAQIRSLTKLGGDGNKLVFLDIPDGGKFYVCANDGGATTIDAVKAFMAAVKDGRVEKQSFN